MTKHSIVFLLLLALFSCSKPKQEEKEILKSEEKKILESYDVFVSLREYSIYDNQINRIENTKTADTVISASVFENKMYIITKDLLSVNLENMTEQNLGQLTNKPTRKDLISNRQGVIFISKENVIFKDRNKEQSILSADSPFISIHENPFHSYIYCYDSLGYLYAVNMQTRMLKRKFFVGRLNSISFSKYGTRILCVTDKSFLVLDYETLNVIFEKKDFFTQAVSYETKDLIFLYSSIDNKCWIYSNIDYKKITDFNVSEKDIQMKTLDDSLMILFSKEKKSLTLFNREKRVARRIIKTENDVDFLFIDSRGACLKSDSLVFLYDILNDTTRKISYFPELLKVHKFYLKTPAVKAENENKVLKEFFTVQIYSLSNKDYAEKMSKQLKAKIEDCEIFVSDTAYAGKTLFRVCAGAFLKREDAEILREGLVKKGFGRDIIVKKMRKND